jgi:arylsulfatase A-like enzyme
MFGNDDYFFEAFGDHTPCDFQTEITHNWAALVGPGVKPDKDGTNVFTDHTDLRPTLLSLVGLEDDYDHDGRAIFEIMTHNDPLPDPRAARNGGAHGSSPQGD